MSTEAWADLCRWGEAHGASVEKRLELDGFGGLRLRHDRSSLCTDALMLVEVPRRLWLEVPVRDTHEAAEVALARSLVHERRKQSSSFWVPYLEMLPEVPDSVLSLTPEACDLLPLGVKEAASDLRRRAHSLSSEEERPDDFIWALGCVWSRAFRAKVSEGEVVALIPMADAFNHCDDEDALQTMQGFDGYDFYVGTKGASGSNAVDATIRYRAGATDAGLLLQYGFCAENNWHAEAAVELCGFRLAILTSGAVGVIASDFAVRLHDTPGDWENLLCDAESFDAPSTEELFSWNALMQDLLQRAAFSNHGAAVQAIEEAFRQCETKLDCSTLHHDASLEHIIRLRESTSLLLRLARGRLPWLVRLLSL